MSGLHLHHLTIGWLETNCYIVFDRHTSTAIVVDPGADDLRVTDFIQSRHLQVTSIINTHGHGDHIAGNAALSQACQCPIWIHALDQAALQDPRQNLSALMGAAVSSPPASRTIADGDTIGLGRHTLQVLHTPGHSPGSICLLSDHWLISGDTLFYRSVGRTDLPGGNSEALRTSLREKLLPLPDHLHVWPGHGPATTMGQERRLNAYLKGGKLS